MEIVRVVVSSAQAVLPIAVYPVDPSWSGPTQSVIHVKVNITIVKILAGIVILVVPPVQAQQEMTASPVTHLFTT